MKIKEIKIHTSDIKCTNTIIKNILTKPLQAETLMSADKICKYFGLKPGLTERKKWS